MNARLFLARAALTALGVFVAARVVPGIECPSWDGLVAVALLLGFLNAFARPMLVLLSLPLVVVSFGLFFWIINAALLAFVGWVVESFEVASFWSALAGSAVIGFVSWIGGGVLGIRRLESARSPRPTQAPTSPVPPGPAGPAGPRRPGGPPTFPHDPGGPIIDV